MRRTNKLTIFRAILHVNADRLLRTEALFQQVARGRSDAALERPVGNTLASDAVDER